MATVDKIFDWVSIQAGKPLVILGLTMLLVIALTVGMVVDALNLSLSIASLDLSLMILGRQNRNEERDQARDLALHGKINELIAATEGARDELIHVEDKTTDEIDQLTR